MKNVYIIGLKRTPIGKFRGIFNNISAIDLMSYVIKDLVNKNIQIKKAINEVIIGNVLSAGLGQNPARIAAIKAGLSFSIPAYSINKVCGSGLKSVVLGAQSIMINDNQLILTGGMENMSQAPYILDNYRSGVKMGEQRLKDSMITDGLFCSLIGKNMGITAENIAKKYKISRKQQDIYALYSHKKAINAINQGKFIDEIVPIKIDKKIFNRDEQPRKNTSLFLLSKLKPVFKINGTVTAGNSSSINDAAAAVLIASEDFIKKNKIKPLVKIINYSTVGINPNYMGLGSYYAAKKCIQNAKLTISDINLWEINEAFSSQIILVIKLLGVNKNIVNVNGGAISLGHPIGASGTRILVSLVHEMKRRKLRYGLASLCIGGGQGIAMLVENI